MNMCENKTYEDFVGETCELDGKICIYEGDEDQCPLFSPDFLNGYCDSCNGNDILDNEENSEICRWDRKPCWKFLPRIPYLRDIHKKNGNTAEFDIYIGRRVRFHKFFKKIT